MLFIRYLQLFVIIKPNFLLCPRKDTNEKTPDLQPIGSIRIAVPWKHTKETGGKARMTEAEEKVHYVS